MPSPLTPALVHGHRGTFTPSLLPSPRELVNVFSTTSAYRQQDHSDIMAYDHRDNHRDRDRDHHQFSTAIYQHQHGFEGRKQKRKFSST